jgi:zinc transporter ZupT
MVTIFFSNAFKDITPIALSIAGGGFIYLSLVDIVPDLHKETKLGKIVIETFFLLIGIFIIFILTKFLH